jgi:antitoxin component YwqK of YwqJK toxin-antitoxin module
MAQYSLFQTQDCQQLKQVITYHENGNMQYSWFEDSNGIKKGEAFLYYKYHKDKVACKWIYKDNVPDGLCLGYNEDGIISSNFFFKDGKLDGECFYLDNNGVKRTEIYENGKLRFINGEEVK